MAEVWAPALDEVGRLVLTRTRDTAHPGEDVLLGTFTANTTPNSDQAQAAIDAAVTGLLSETGPLDLNDKALLAQARVAAAWRAAADIELMDPNRDADLAAYDKLDARAKYELTLLIRRLQALGEGTAESVPFWSSGPLVPYADRDPGDYTPVLGPGYWGGIDGRWI